MGLKPNVLLEERGHCPSGAAVSRDSDGPGICVAVQGAVATFSTGKEASAVGGADLSRSLCGSDTPGCQSGSECPCPQVSAGTEWWGMAALWSSRALRGVCGQALQ